MLDVRQWEWHSLQGHAENDEDGSTGRVVGVVASGIDLVSDLFVRLQQENAEAAGHYALQSGLLPEAELRPRNRRALALLQGWMSEPEELGAPWWDDFERDLRQHRLALREND